MNRTQDFFSFITSEPQDSQPKKEPPFYYDMLNRIRALQSRLEGVSNIKVLLGIEDAFFCEQSKSREILESIQVAGNNSLAMHYEGIKYIIGRELLSLSKALRTAKMNCGTSSQILEPERPARFRKTTINANLERENKKIIQREEYEVARQHLMRIEKAQQAIYENLILQEERIDQISDITMQTKTVYNQLNDEEDIGSGSFMRRLATKIIYSLIFALIFVRFFYK